MMANDVSYFRVNGDSATYAFNDADLTAAINTINARLVGENLMDAIVWQTSGTLTLSKAITGYKKLFVILGSPANASGGASGAYVLSWNGNRFAANQRYTFPCYNGYVALFITDANTVTIEHADMGVRMLVGYTEQ